MGKKYGSIHVQTKDGLQMANAILASCDNEPNEFLRIAESIENRRASYAYDLARTMRRYAALCRDEFFVVITDNWVSLYNRDMTFQTIASKARSFARKFSEPILYTSNFDDDVFVFGLLEEGKTVTSGRICETPEFYDITNKAANMTALRRVLGEYPDMPKRMPSDISALEEMLTALIGVPLFLYQDEAYRNPDQYEQVAESNGICVYRKINA